ncbi:MAG: phosphate acetyltransferase [Burkholderiaceae bacterium]
MSKHPHLDHLIRRAATLPTSRVAVVYPCSFNAIEAAASAQAIELIQPVMVGPSGRIRALAEQHGVDVSTMEFVDTDDDPRAAARAAVKLCHEERADVVMKGSQHTDELLGVLVGKDSGMRTARRMSHAFIFDLPTYPKLLMMADCVVNINPVLMEKRDIVQNAIDLAHSLDVDEPYVAILSAVETVNPAILGTIDAASLCKMAHRGQITGAIVDGPLSFDVAISAKAAAIKNVALMTPSPPDILIVPNLEAGNMLYKQLVYLAGAECAGVILGTKVPIVITSRADSSTCRLASCALASLHAHHQRRLAAGTAA